MSSPSFFLPLPYSIKQTKKDATKDGIFIPVFIALGIGGEPDSPEQMYIVPLKKLQKPSASFDELKIYRRQYPDRNLYWDTKEGVLK